MKTKIFIALLLSTLMYKVKTNAQAFSSANIQPFSNTFLNKVIDFDNDGDDDVYGWNLTTNGNGKLFRNNGNSTFTDVSNETNFPSLANGIAADLDKNGFMDLYYRVGDTLIYTLNNSGVFSIANFNCGKLLLSDLFNCNPSDVGSTELADYNNDGTYDLVSVILNGSNAEIKAIAGSLSCTGCGVSFNNNPAILTSITNQIGPVFSFADVNNDGSFDLLIGNGTQSAPYSSDYWNYLYSIQLNDGNGNFSLFANSGYNVGRLRGFGTLGEFNNDGRVDILSGTADCCVGGSGGSGNINPIYTFFSNATGGYNSSTTAITRAADRKYYGTPTIVDLNLDGKQDVVWTDIYAYAFSSSALQYYINNGNSTFTESSAAFGINLGTSPTPVLHTSQLSTVIDLNNDKKPDLNIISFGTYNQDFYNNNTRLNTTANNSVKLKLIACTGLKEGWGARISYKTGGVWNRNQHSSYAGANNPFLYLGIGANSSIDSLVVNWIGGATTYYTNINAGAYFVATESNSCASQIGANVTPTFQPISQICKNVTESPLPTVSNNGINGTWSPTFNTDSSRVYTFTPDSGQCANVTTLNIEVADLSSTNISASSCNTYTWNGTTYTQSGTYTWTGTNATGCDSVVTLNLTINQPSAETVNASITEGETYNFNGQNLTTAGTYTSTLQNAAGCDSLVTLNLTVEPAVEPLNCEISASESSICLNGQVNLSASYSGSIQSNSSATWQLIGNLPEARGSSAGYIDNGKIWIHAGANSVEMRPTSMYFDLGTNTSGFSSNIPFPRGEVGYGRVNDKFYVIGGYTGSSASNNTQEYDIENGTWTSKANMPTSRSVLSSAVLNNQLYVLGGWPGTQNTFERYTPESNTWETLPVIPTARHSVNSAAAIDNKVYFLSGKDAWMTQFYNANECFDPATNSWQTKAPVPQPVYGGAAASHNGKLYLVGGSTGSYNSYINGSQTIFKTVQIYDPSNDTWTMGPELPVATSLATLISDGVDLYLVGGMSKNDNGSQWFISSSIYKLSNTSQTSILWSTGETTPSISVSPTETTTYSVTVTQGGQTCTSDVTITVNQPSAETVNATITEGETYNFNGQNLTEAGTYTATLQNAAGCDSVVTLNLSVGTSFTCGITSPITEICNGDEVNLLAITNSIGDTKCQSDQLPSNLQNGLIAYYPFCGNANDASVSSNNAVVNGASLTADRFGQSQSAYNFNGNASIIPMNNVPEVVNTFSYSVWVNPSTTCVIPPASQTAYAAAFLSNPCVIQPVHGETFGDPYSNAGSGLYVGTNGLYVLEHSTAWEGVPLNYEGDLSGWHLITIVYQSKVPSLFIDGNYISSGIPSPYQIHISLGPDIYYGNSGFGSGYGNAQYFIGDIDDMFFFNRALSTSEVAQLYSNQSNLWSTGETTPSISVSPTQTTTYSVTVTQGTQTCTSEVTITVNQPSAETVNANITEGETYNFNGQNLTTAGTYTATLQNAAGCDSLVTLNLMVEPAVEPFNCEISSSTDSICLGGSVSLSVPFEPSTISITNQVIIPRAAAFEYTYSPEGNWKTTTGGWSVANAPFGNASQSELAFFNAFEFAYNTLWPANTTLYLRKSIDLNGFDLNGINWKLGVDNGFELYLNGNLVAQDYQDGFTSTWEYQGIVPSQYLVQGENIVALRLTDGGSLTAFDMMLEGTRITESTSLLWSTGETTPSISVSPSETTTYSVTVALGNQTCTSEVTITVNQPSSETVNATITEGETYNFNGQNLTTAGTYTATLQNAAGCDSVVTLNLTVNPAPVAGCYATSVVNFSQGLNAIGNAVSAIRSNEELALGMPEPVVTNVVNFVSLGFGGSITLAFEARIANGAGNDIRIDEATWNNNPCNRYPERADVFASQDGVNFVYLGVACQDASFDLGALSWAQYVRIVDVSDRLSFSIDADGFDVNGIECLNGAATSLNDDGLVACSLQEIVSYTPGNRKNGTAVGAPRNNPANALGTPQNNNTINFTALGFGGTVVAKFDYVVFNQPGNDLRVTETSFGNPSCNNYPEKARVSVSMDNINWTELGEICQDGEIDLANVNYAQYIKIQDASTLSSNKFNGAADGYDVDAVVVLNNGCGTSSARLAQMDNTTTPDASLMVSAFPNPMEDYTIVNFEGLENDSDFNFQIMDAAGRVIRNQNIRVTANNPTYLFDASELARGIYQVIIANENGSNIIRLVK